MGLYKREDSQFYWMSYKVLGKRIFESTGTTNRKLAESIYAKRMVEVVEGKWFDRRLPEDVTVGELIERYLKKVSINLSPSTQERNRQNCSEFDGVLWGLSLT